ncbi:TetR/AcrR family transcriptional regulator [Mycolicibacterium komossense]|uniref:TetR/AcrR family transcriptional regulator n=1 Tax=Mycolicibacterium komossense TaxID=1779 RepID=A0ABT3CJY1_9MYCO|nr:TetR/AcrR family transcriptional regulator [Mycolicibacterium komossense]MCV7229821.1 TetR/AcrR family transcriptional regulator [Mycolicibacterium komossense]
MTSDSQSSPRRSRRDEYAELTRTAVVDAARTLFAERGYFATTINEIADRGRVSSGTVYQQCGGKQGLLRTLMDMWTTSPLVAETLSSIRRASTLEESLELLTEAYLGMHSQFDDIIQTVSTTAAQDGSAAAALAVALARHRAALLEIAATVRPLGGFPVAFSDDDFADLALFYYGAHGGFHFLIAVLGWPAERARRWLHKQFVHSLLDATASA